MDITPEDVLYVADYQLRLGIVIANASDFSEIGFIENAMPEGVTVGQNGERVCRRGSAAESEKVRAEPVASSCEARRATHHRSCNCLT